MFAVECSAFRLIARTSILMRIRSFKGLVPAPQHASEVAAVPYDVVNREEAAALAAGAGHDGSKAANLLAGAEAILVEPEAPIAMVAPSSAASLSMRCK